MEERLIQIKCNVCWVCSHYIMDNAHIYKSHLKTIIQINREVAQVIVKFWCTSFYHFLLLMCLKIWEGCFVTIPSPLLVPEAACLDRARLISLVTWHLGCLLKERLLREKGETAKEEPPWSWPLVFVTVFIAQRPAGREPSVNISLTESDNQALIPQRVRRAQGKVAEGHGAPWSAVGRPLEGNGSLSSPQGKAVISVTPCLETDNVQPGSESPFWPWGCPWKARWAPERLGRGSYRAPARPTAPSLCPGRVLLEAPNTRVGAKHTTWRLRTCFSLCLRRPVYIPGARPSAGSSALSQLLGTPEAGNALPREATTTLPDQSGLAEAQGRAGAQRRRSEGFGRWVELAPYGPWMKDPGVLPKLQSLRGSQNLPFQASKGNIN